MKVNEIFKNEFSITKEIIDEKLDLVTTHFEKQIRNNCYKVYGNNTSSLIRDSFAEEAKLEIRESLVRFFLVSKYTLQDRNLDIYLQTVLKRLSNKIYWENQGAKKIILPTCPACKFVNGSKEILEKESLGLICYNCKSESQRISKTKDPTSQQRSIMFLRNAFQCHSNKGKKCPDCFRFMPISMEKDGIILCPYPECAFVGPADECEDKTHPIILTTQKNKSLNEEIKGGGSESSSGTLEDFISGGELNSDKKIDFINSLRKELNTLKEVVSNQKKANERSEGKGVYLYKKHMYEAFEEMIDGYPEEMVSYLVHRKQTSSFPLQAAIFQKYLNILEKNTPFVVGEKSIKSIYEKSSEVFLGESAFEVEVNKNNVLKNKTVEKYIGGIHMKDYGPCYIGKIKKLTDCKTGKDLTNQIDYYSFSNVKMKPSVPVGTKIKVEHYRIPAHYEIGHLVYLQRVKKKIVGSVFFKFNGKKRKAYE